MNILSLEGVSKHYGIKPLFDDATLGLDEQDKVGLIGLNGSGKTTLLKVIAGIEPPDTGRISIMNGRTVAYLPQNPPFIPEQTVLDAIFSASGGAMALLHDYEAACDALAHNGADESLLRRVSELGSELEAAGAWELETDARIVLGKLGLTDTSAPMGKLSGGQRRRVALAHALLTRPDLLILDEPTNHLDADTVAWLETYLQRYPGALLLVTHDRYFLDRVTNRIFELDRGAIQSFTGGYSDYLEAKEAQDALRAVEGEKRDNLARRELAWLRRGAKARSTKQKARVGRAETLLAQPKEKDAEALDIATGSRRIGSKIVELHGVSKGYGGQPLIRDFSYALERGDRLGIIGPNGSGKTTLLDMLVGRLAPDSGRVEIGQTVVLGYYDQESRALNDQMRVIDYIREVAENIQTADGQLITAGQMLQRFLFPPAMQYAEIGRLSGGERRRLYLLRILMAAPNVLVLDEPTNDLDIQTLTALEEYLDTFPGALIAVSHDRYFLDRTVQHLFRLEGDGEVREIPGNYSAYLERRAADQAAESEAARAKPAPSPPIAAQPPTAQKKLSFKEQKELSDLEAAISGAEAKKVKLEAELAKAAADFGRVQRLCADIAAIDAKLDRDMARWSELA